MAARPVDPAGRRVPRVRRDADSRLRPGAAADIIAFDLRYRLDVVATDVTDVVRFAGGWMYDRSMAGWDVTVLIDNPADIRPLLILGVEVADLESALVAWQDRPHPQTVAVSAELIAGDDRVRRGVLGALGQGRTEVTLWGERWLDGFDDTVAMRHELSAAARAFKAQALSAVDGPVIDVDCLESFRCGTATDSFRQADRSRGVPGGV